jgi:hypothetical protein
MAKYGLNKNAKGIFGKSLVSSIFPAAKKNKTKKPPLNMSAKAKYGHKRNKK